MEHTEQEFSIAGSGRFVSEGEGVTTVRFRASGATASITAQVRGAAGSTDL